MWTGKLEHPGAAGFRLVAECGGWAVAVVSGNLDPIVPGGALGFVGALRELPGHPASGRTLSGLALPQRQQPTR